LLQTEEGIMTRANAIRAQHGDLYTKISSFFEPLIALLTARRDTLLSDLASITSKKQKQL